MGERRLCNSHTPEARRSSEILLAKVLNTDREGLLRKARAFVTERERQHFLGFIRSREHRMPVAYLTGNKEFFSLDFNVNRSVLIPRPETEFLVEEALHVFGNHTFENPLVCDVGCGSGVIGITLKTKLPYLEVVGADISEDSLIMARQNALAHRANIQYICSDLLKGVQGYFHMIVANLPYVCSDEIHRLHQEVRCQSHFFYTRVLTTTLGIPE